MTLIIMVMSTICLLGCGCEYFREKMWPGSKIIRTPLESFTTRQLPEMGLVIDWPKGDMLDEEPIIGKVSSKYIRINFHPLHTPNGSSLWPVYWMTLDIYRLSKEEFNVKYQHWLFEADTWKVLTSGFDYLGKEKDEEFADWARAKHPQAVCRYRNVYNRLRKTSEQIVIVRWFEAPDGFIIYCVGDIFPYYVDYKSYVEEDVKSLKRIINSIKITRKVDP